MKICYKKIEKGLELIRVWSSDHNVMVPEEINHEKIVSIAPYAFSNHKTDEEKDTVTVMVGESDGREELMAGSTVVEVHLPPTIEIIGNYAFYGCINMTTFHASDRVKRMGSGVFTGCRLSRVLIDFYEGEKSCLKEILTEIRYEVIAGLRYHGEDKITENKIIFPEHYLDAVENTPARIVENRYYGSGGEYRECFYRKELDYLKYDRQFSLSEARDNQIVTAAVALMRLKYPYKLNDAEKKIYEMYLKENIKTVVEALLEDESHSREFYTEDPVDILSYCCENKLFSEETIQEAVHMVSEKGQTEMLCILMDARHRLFSHRKRKFEL